MKLTSEQQEQLEQINKDYEWSDWRPFPNPEKKGYLCAPLGPGVYHLRYKSSGDLILFGESKTVAFRMTSLLSKELGQGGRDNAKKRNDVTKNISDIEYRTLACRTKKEAKAIETELKKIQHKHSE